MKLIDVECKDCGLKKADVLVSDASFHSGCIHVSEVDEECPKNCEGKCLVPALSVSTTKGHSTWSVKK